MMPDRWTLEKWAKFAVVAAYLFFAMSALLERSRANARREAESAVQRHHWNEHAEETDE